MTVEAMNRALPLYESYKELERLLICLRSPVSEIVFKNSSCSIPIPEELAEPVRNAIVVVVEQELERQKAEFEAL